jgi:hypothetical protein
VILPIAAGGDARANYNLWKSPYTRGFRERLSVSAQRPSVPNSVKICGNVHLTRNRPRFSFDKSHDEQKHKFGSGPDPAPLVIRRS